MTSSSYQEACHQLTRRPSYGTVTWAFLLDSRA